ncbi:hypothetical protein [Tumebacillus lipolyticus]|uniref:Uncharacterized protein n=1 Tax=Tumebacillus lipolyticus TaxID=1280370 RepID=A0ABW4ZXX2_9BACL
MKKKMVLAALVGAMTLAGAGSVSAASVDFEKTGTGAEGYVAAVENTDLVTIQDWVYTRGYSKSYQNLYGITVATQTTNTQWRANDAKTQNLASGSLWQDNWATIAYGYKDETNAWNYFYSNVGQAKQSVKFESGIPTPWGHVGGSNFTSTIVTNVSPDGSTTAY